MKKKNFFFFGIRNKNLGLKEELTGVEATIRIFAGRSRLRTVI